jgi:hypothetical protein
LTRPQLIAVTDNVNQSKGDQGPSTWQPVGPGVPMHVREDVERGEVPLDADPASLGEDSVADRA